MDIPHIVCFTDAAIERSMMGGRIDALFYNLWTHFR
jgi:hypothetical protein